MDSTGADRRTRLDRTGLDRAGRDRAEGETDREPSYPRDCATSYPQAQKNPATGAGSRWGRLSEDGQPDLVCHREQPEGDHDPSQSLNPEGYFFAVHRVSLLCEWWGPEGPPLFTSQARTIRARPCRL